MRLSVGVEKDQAVLRVFDEGTGISPHVLERIFEPFVRAGDEEQAVRGGGRAAAPEAVRPSRGAGESVLLVEDQDDNRMLLAEILADAGYVVLPAADGKEALDLIELRNPPMAVVDIGLPVLSGYDVAREVRTRLQRGDMFLVALTGYGQQQDREAVLEAGFD